MKSSEASVQKIQNLIKKLFMPGARSSEIERQIEQEEEKLVKFIAKRQKQNIKRAVEDQKNGVRTIQFHDPCISRMVLESWN